MKPPRLLAKLLWVGLSQAPLLAHAAQPGGDSESQIVKKLEDKVDSLTNELEELKAEIRQLKAQGETLTQKQEAQAKVVEEQKATQGALQAEVKSTSDAIQEVASKPSPLENLSLWGYGEIYYTRPVHQPDLTQADLARAVFGIGYQFTPDTRFNSEFEVEHAVSSASDVGEFEVEQFYLDHTINPHLGLTTGLFLIPSGLLNESHEPTNFYGVQRNFVETLIIPSTWREGGINLHGTTDDGFRWSVGLTTGMDLSKWNFTPEYVPYRTALELEDNDVAPLQATHQELALANAEHLATYVSGDYSGIAGLRVGGSLFTGGVVRNLPNIPDNERVTLWEAHARYNPGKLDLSALYARGTLSNTAEANVQYPGTPNPIPASFYGWYLQAAYNVWQSGDYRLAPFVRYERYNMGASYEGLAPGFGPTPSGLFPTSPVPNSFGTYPIPNDIVSTIGANFYTAPGVVFKVDYQHFNVNRDFSRLDLGMGLAF